MNLGLLKNLQFILFHADFIIALSLLKLVMLPIVPEHFILATSSFRSQTDLLGEDGLTAT